MIKLVAFDLDDTLYPEEEFVLSGFKAVSQYVSENYKGNYNFFELLVKLYKQGVRGNTFNQGLSMAGIEYDGQRIQELVQIYRLHIPTIRLYPETDKILKEICGCFKLGLITDGHLKTQRNKVKALEIEQRFHKIIYTDELGSRSWKPSETAFCELMKFFRVEGKQCVYIGDNPEKDFIAPKKLGWATVRIIRRNGQYKNLITGPELGAQTTIFSLEELPPLLRNYV